MQRQREKIQVKGMREREVDKETEKEGGAESEGQR